MSKLLNQTRAIKLLRAHGWERSIGGNSVKMIKPGFRPITLPRHKGQDYSPGLTRAILTQARISPDQL